ncbi:VPGUxxT family thioredoxin-like (seleno)protein, type 2 [Roseibium sediminis]|uniref:VPGUxxT family thioredoxin-like (seleno)protein, type 2 n=1 Tax=Roseibium sediminis TaxID=1775174 RepID=UPI00123D9FDC|nr:VPGUxxT family thioredoxin-like (seleno)protein, type 2 [Roseibium sediminis]
MTIFQKKTGKYPELGEVNWLRSLEAAKGQAALNGKPILLQFQEVPGCSTCVNYGRDVLSRPLMVELIEECFVPVAIFNNVDGADAEVLAQFGEAAWNNPVSYFLSSTGNVIGSKLQNRYNALSMLDKIIETLRSLGRDVPGYADLLRADLLVEQGLSRKVVFETPCFWSGETTLAQHPAVLTTLAGWVDGEEVVEAEFDPEHDEASTLIAYAEREGFRLTNQRGFRVDEDPQYYLSKTRFALLPLSPAQRTRINVDIPYKTSPERNLSPSQKAWMAEPRLEGASSRAAYKAAFEGEWRQLATRLADAGSPVPADR